MKSNLSRLLVAISLIAIVGLSMPVQSAAKKPATKAKSSAVCSKKAPKKAAAKPSAKKNNVKAKPSAKTPKALPRLLDLGATKCVPCKMMVPVLDDLKKEYKGKLKVEFIDVRKDESVARKYKVQSIPTQIFFNAKGKEVYRHTGYFPKDDIIKAFKDHGIKLGK